MSASPLERPVRWQSGYAEACKASYVGSIPARTSRRKPFRPLTVSASGPVQSGRALAFLGPEPGPADLVVTIVRYTDEANQPGSKPAL